MKSIKCFIFCFGLISISFGQTPTVNNTPSVQTPVPGQEELEKAKSYLLSKNAATTMSLKAQTDQYEQDRLTARSWFEKARDKGNADAELFLYTLYDCNYDHPPFDIDKFPDIRFLANEIASRKNQSNPDEKGEFDRLYEILIRSAQQGNPESQYLLGFYYLYGKLPNGKKIDHVAALKWISLAAQQGQASAEAEMGAFYHYGCKEWPELGLPCDEALSREWFEKAAAHGNLDAKGMIDRLDSEGMSLDKKGLLGGNPMQKYENGQPFELDEPITLKTTVLKALLIVLPRPTKRLKDYVEIKGSLHWDDYRPSLRIESFSYIEDHGEHLVESLIKPDHVPGLLELKFKDGTPEAVMKKILSSIGIPSPSKIWKPSFTPLLKNTYSVKLKKNMTVKKALKILVNNSVIEFAQPDYRGNLLGGKNIKGHLD